MKVNQIVSFGRVIKINSDSQQQSQTNKVDNSTYEIGKILNSEHTNKYSNQQASDIRDFFKDVLGDYNGYSGILIKKSLEGDIVLLSGQDARNIERLEKRKKHSPKRAIDSIVQTAVSKKLSAKESKADECSLEFKTGKKTKTGFSIFNKIIYSKTSVSYGHQVDGRVSKNPLEQYNNKGRRVLYKVSYEEKSLDL